MKKLVFISLFIPAFNAVQAQSPCATKMVLMEEACAKNCGPCYFHCRDYINPLYASHINQMAMVVYNQAPIGVGTWTELTKPYYAFGDIFNLQYQSMVMMDRTFFPNNYLLQQGPTSEGVETESTAFNDQINSTYVPVSVNISNTYNAQTRAVNINVTANFCDTASGDLRFYLVLTQDTVKGPAGQPYSQNVNASAGTTLDGYPVVQYPGWGGASWIPSYSFINPVKYQPSGFFGNAGIIAAHPIQGSSYTENFSFTLPLKNDPSEAIDIDANRIQIVAAVVRNGPFKQRQVINANKKYLVTGANSIAQTVKNSVQFSATNPVSSSLLVNYSATNKGEAELYLYNASGEIIKVIRNIEYSPSNSSKTIDVSGLAEGIYFVSLRADGVFHTRKIIVVR